LTESEYLKIIQILGREASYTELGIFSVMWSEHCSYKSSRVHLQKLPTRGKLVVQGPGENARHHRYQAAATSIAFKDTNRTITTSFIEPFQGAAPEWVAFSATSSPWAQRTHRGAGFAALRPSG